ncbi:MraW methylase family protein isoform 3, partial [Theobroma cacao]
MAHFIPGCICLIEMMIDLGLESMAAKAKQMMLMMLSSSFSFSVSSLSAPASVSAVRHPTKSCALVRSACRSISTDTSKKKKKKKEKGNWNAKALEKEKRRTRSLRDCDIEIEEKEEDDSSSTSVMMQQTQTQTHVPVMLGEVLDVFSSNSKPLCSFVDCTLGAGGHASAAHPELKLFIGMDVDPLALHMACSRIRSLSHSHPHPHFQAFTFLDNFRHIKSLLRQVVHPDIFSSGVDGILMDLGMSSMQVNNPERGFSVLANGPLDMRMDPQASLKAEDILNSWPDIEVGRILRDYGEESNWWLLQNKIIQARLQGGLHSTGELVDVIRSVNPRTRGGRQGWVK